MIKVPKKIHHGHIVDAVVEIRFAARREQTVILDILSSISKYISDYKFNPTDIPKQFRQADPQLSYSADLTLVGDKFSIGIGVNTIIFSCQNGYKSWDQFFPFIISILESVQGNIERVLRIGVRFTNFFENLNDLRKFNVSFSAGYDENVTTSSDAIAQMVVKFSTVPSNADGIAYNVTVANQARVANKALTGILVDVDAYVDQPILANTGKALYEFIDKTHTKEKVMFFSLLEKSFLESLQPEY